MLKEYGHLYHLNGYAVESNTSIVHYADDRKRIFKQMGIDDNV